MSRRTLIARLVMGHAATALAGRLVLAALVGGLAATLVAALLGRH